MTTAASSTRPYLHVVAPDERARMRTHYAAAGATHERNATRQMRSRLDASESTCDGLNRARRYGRPAQRNRSWVCSCDTPTNRRLDSSSTAFRHCGTEVTLRALGGSG